MHIRRPIVLFGDSITQYSFGEGPDEVQVGWASLLSSTYQRRADVLNRGYSGYNTRHAVELVDQIFYQPGTLSPPLFCTVWFGANDATIPGERQHVPPDEYGDNLTKIVTSIRQQLFSGERGDGSPNGTDNNYAALPPIIVMTPPPLDEETWKRELGLYDYYDRTNARAREYGLIAKAKAEELGCPLLDTWELLGGSSKTVQDYGQHLRDGLHLSDSGNRLVHTGLMNLIETQIPHLAPSKLIDGMYSKEGIQVEGALWTELC